MSDYRVDRVDSKHVPCGMNSILYIGNNFNKAIKIFNEAKTGFNQYNEKDESYGVVISKWQGLNGMRLTGEYVIFNSKGL